MLINRISSIIIITLSLLTGIPARAEDESAAIHHQRAVDDFNRADYTAAVSELQQAIELSPKPEPATLYFELAITYENLNQPDQAIINYEKGLTLDPTFVNAYTQLCSLYLNKQQFIKAYQYIKSAQNLAPENKGISQIVELLDTKFKMKGTLDALAKNSAFQDKRGETGELVTFIPKISDFPFTIKYPSNWYAREENLDTAKLYLTREPVRQVQDQYKVGMGIYYNKDYFVSREPAGSQLGKMAKVVLKVVNWDQDKDRFIENLKNQGALIISRENIMISGEKAVKIEYHMPQVYLLTYYIKAGNDQLMISFEAPPQEFDNYKPIFQDMSNSVAFKPDFKAKKTALKELSEY